MTRDEMIVRLALKGWEPRTGNPFACETGRTAGAQPSLNYVDLWNETHKIGAVFATYGVMSTCDVRTKEYMIGRGSQVAHPAEWDDMPDKSLKTAYNIIDRYEAQEQGYDA